MLSQVAELGSKYNKWVSSPVDRQLRLFENPFLENLTITPWYVVPIVWIPIIAILAYFGTVRYVTLAPGMYNNNSYCCIYFNVYSILLNYFINNPKKVNIQNDISNNLT